MRAVSPIRLKPHARMYAFAGDEPTALFLDEACRRPASHPVVADDRGWFPPVYAKADVELRYRDKDGRDIAPPEPSPDAPVRVVERVIVEQAPPPQIIERVIEKPIVTERVVERAAPTPTADIMRLTQLQMREELQGLSVDEEAEKKRLEQGFGLAH